MTQLTCTGAGGSAAVHCVFPAWEENANNTAAFLAAVTCLGATQTDTATTFGSLAGTVKWYGGVLAPNGMIYGIPYGATAVLKIDPTTDTATTFGSLAGTEKWAGGVLAPNGMVYGIPFNSTTVLKLLSTYAVPEDFPLARQVNKF